MTLEPYEEKMRQNFLKVFNQLSEGWTEEWDVQTLSVGAINAIGFSKKDPHKIICDTIDFTSMIDCQTLAVEKLENCVEDNLTLYVPALDEVIPMAGLAGGGLPKTSSDTWLDIVSPYYPLEHVVLYHPFTIWQHQPEKARIVFKDFGIKAVGFNKTGDILAIAGTDLTIARRKES